LLSPFLGIFIILAKSITLRGTHSQSLRSEPHRDFRVAYIAAQRKSLRNGK
jgi:hypothetical protein